MKKKQTVAAINDLISHVSCVVPSITLENHDTGETLNPDTVAIKAGAIAGLNAARSMLEAEVPQDCEIDMRGVLGEVMVQASKIYLKMTLEAEAGGVDNG